MARIVLLCCAVFLLAYFAGNVYRQPAPHRQVQSEDALWKIFYECKPFTGPNLSSGIGYTSEVKGMNGKKISLGGFMVPLEAKETTRHFIMCRRAPTCAFCPPGEPNEMVEVFFEKPMRWQENLVTVQGTLVLPKDTTRGVFFQLRDAS